MMTTTATTTEPLHRALCCPRCRILMAVIGCWAIACAPVPAETAADDTPARAPDLHRGPLADYVSAAGLRWLVIGEPARLARDRVAARELGRLFPEPRLEAYARATGVDLRRTPSALVAGQDLGTLYMAEAGGFVGLPEERFAERLISEPIIQVPAPSLRRITGVVGNTAQSLVGLDDEWVAVAVGDPLLARIVVLYATGRLKRSPSALEGAALRALPRDVSDAQLRLLIPGPVPDEWAPGAGGLLAAATALGCYARVDGEAVKLSVVLSGSWGGTDQWKLQQAWEELSQSGIGRLLGVDEPTAAPLVETSREHLSLTVGLALRPIVSGLRAAVSADVWEIMTLPSSKPGAERSLDLENDTPAGRLKASESRQ